MKRISFVICAILIAFFISAGCMSSDSPEKTTGTQISQIDITEAPTPSQTAISTPVIPTVIETPTPTPTMKYYVHKDSLIVHQEGCSHIKIVDNYFVVTDPGDYQKCNWWK